MGEAGSLLLAAMEMHSHPGIEKSKLEQSSMVYPSKLVGPVLVMDGNCGIIFWVFG